MFLFVAITFLKSQTNLRSFDLLFSTIKSVRFIQDILPKLTLQLPYTFPLPSSICKLLTIFSLNPVLITESS